MSRGLSLAGLLLVALAAFAQDLPVQANGRLESSWTWSADALPDGGQTWSLVSGWAGMTAGTRDVKTELRLSFTSAPVPQLNLSRAWTKFRFPGLRFTTGLGRLAWGQGFVFVPGDLLFDSVGTDVDFGGDELRTQPAWLADAWTALGDEAFVEVGALREAAALRVSAAPGGVTLEAASGWDASSQSAKFAASTQFHAGVDWYATARQDWPPTDGPVVSGGAFGHWALGEDWTLSTRHEGLMRTASASLRSYHDLSLGADGWSLTGRMLFDRDRASWSPTAEARWAPLQNLGLSATASLQPPWWGRAAVTAKW